MLAPGTIIDGRFEIVEFLGEGGMGTVYAARHKTLERTIALKLLKASLVRDDEKIARFRNEARVLSSLQHPNIIAIHAIGVADSGQPYMAMDIVSGESISDAIQRRGPFSQDEALRICIEICSGLHYAHSNQIIHRDVKPSNVILSTTDGGAVIPKLVDFGIAKVLNPASGQNLTQTGVAVGSVFYLSPGQLEGRAADPASDIYSLGCTLYEMLTGVPPFEADNLFEAAMSHKHDELIPINQRYPKANVDSRVESIVACTLAKEHHLRYQSAETLQADLAAALQDSPLKFAPQLAKQRSAKQKTKLTPAKPLVPLAALTCCLIIAGALVLVAPKTQESYLRSEVDTLLKEAYGRVDMDLHDLPKALAVYDRVFVTATKKADQTKDPLLMAEAWDLRAEIYNNILLAQHASVGQHKEPLSWQLKAFTITNQALQTSKADTYGPDELLRLRRERFFAISRYVANRANIGELPSQQDFDQFITALKAVGSSVDRGYRLWCGIMLEQIAKTEIAEGNATATIQALVARRAVMDSVGTSETERLAEGRKAVLIMRKQFGSDVATKVAKIYKLN